MGSGNLRNTIGAIKDQTTINLAKLASFSDLHVAIVKATGHKACPAKEHHIREILTLTSYSRHHADTCLAIISKRLNKTKDWVVTLKALILIQRLMEDGNPAFMHQFFVATKNVPHLLDMSNFQDSAWANSWDFSSFIRAYALYLHEQLDSWMKEQEGKCGMFSYADDEDENLSPRAIVLRTTPVQEMENHQIYSRIQHLMKLLDSFLACRPTGAAKNNRIVAIALFPIVKQSFQLYYEITEIMFIFQDRLEEFNAVDSMKVFEIFCRVEKQYEELDTFYFCCIDACIGETSDYPEVKISHKTLDEMDKTIKEKIEMEQYEMVDEPELEPEHEPEPKLEPEQEKDFESQPQRDPDVILDLILIDPSSTSEVSKDERIKPNTQDIGDLLSFDDDFPPTQDHSDQLALALFGNTPVTTSLEKTGTQPWEAFNESSDWETALVQTASQLSNQEPSLPHGFDTLLLDGMYQQAAISSSIITNGSASSVAFGSPTNATPLALPTPPSANGTSPGGDPFSASLEVAPPFYVQMSDMEKKQRLLTEEQIMWQQYQGQVGMDNLYMNHYPYNTRSGYTY